MKHWRGRSIFPSKNMSQWWRPDVPHRRRHPRPTAAATDGTFVSKERRTKMKDGIFKPGDLRLVSLAPPPDDPPLRIGEYCRLNSGGPRLLVVDVDGFVIVVGWDGDRSVKKRAI